MKRSKRVVLGAQMTAAIAIAATLTGCVSTDEPAYEQVCVEEETMVRWDDAYCDEGRPGHAWFYIPYPHGTALAPSPVGSRVTHAGSFTRPSVGSFFRGGFGGMRGGSSGG